MRRARPQIRGVERPRATAAERERQFASLGELQMAGAIDAEARSICEGKRRGPGSSPSLRDEVGDLRAAERNSTAAGANQFHAGAGRLDVSAGVAWGCEMGNDIATPGDRDRFPRLDPIEELAEFVLCFESANFRMADPSV